MDTTLRAALAEALGPTVRLGEELTGGGMARVLRARDLTLDREIVIKVLAPEIAASVNVERFKREVATIARVQHPQVVPVLATGVVAGLPWYSMPFVAGESLAHRMDAGPVRPWEALDILRDVARALAAAHQAGVVHRDIKPGNVLLASGSAVVTDFGLAQAVRAEASAAAPVDARLTQAGTAVGTPAYMAPEQISGDLVDARADVYAWGVLAYELLAGRHPLGERGDAREWLVAHLTVTPPPVTTPGADLPPAVGPLLMACLAKDPSQRPRDGDALLRALDAAVVGDRTSGPTTVPRRRMTPVLLGAAVVAVAGGLLWQRGALPAMRSRAPAESTVSAVPILAVMPFESVGDVGDSTFADGLSDAVTARLARLAGIRVIDRSSVLALASARETPQTVRESLGATLLLRASVRWARDAAGTRRMQVVPTLVRTDDGTTLWVGAPIEAAPGEPFAVQAQVASQVADALDIAIGAAERRLLERAPTADAAAWAAFERGHRLEATYLMGGNPGAGTAALEAFRDAAQRDPQFADALGAQARLLRLLVRRRQVGASFADSVPVLARRALALDSTEWAAAEVLAQEAVARGHSDDAFGLVEKAIAARPNSAPLQLVRAMVAAMAGDPALVHDAVGRALVLAPRDVEVLERAAFLEFSILRNATLADSLARRGLAYDSTYLPLWRSALTIAVARGDTALAGATFAGYQAHGGPITAPLLSELRRGSSAMRALFRAQSLGSIGASSLPESLSYYAERYRAAASAGDARRARAYADSGAAMQARRAARAASAPARLPGPPPGSPDRLRGMSSGAWWMAVVGDTAGADSLLREVVRLDSAGARPGGPWLAEWACRRAEIAALLGRVDAMLEPLGACLSLPEGYWPARLTTEPMLARYRTDERVQALLRAGTAPRVATGRP